MNTLSGYAHRIASFDWKTEAKENLIPSACGILFGSALCSGPGAVTGFAASYIARRTFNSFGTSPVFAASEYLINRINQHFPSAAKATVVSLIALNYIAPYAVGYYASRAAGFDISIPELLVGSAVAGYVFAIAKQSLQDDPFKKFEVLSVNGSNFQKEVLESELPVIVDAYGSACPPCRIMAPIFSELSKEMKGKVKFVKFNVNDDIELARKLNTTSVPTFLMYKDGALVETVVGGYPKEIFAQKINAALTTN